MAEEKPVEADEASVGAPKKGIARLLPLIGGIAGGLVLGGVLGFTLLGPKLTHRTAAPAHDAKVASGEAAAKKIDAAPPMYQLDNLVMNPAGSGGSHFLLMSVALQVKDAASIEVLKGRDAELRDTILRIFSRKNIDQLSDINSRDQFAAELTTVLGTVFGNGIVTKIYFPQFVIQ